MKLQLRSERLLVGLRGLALLRGWPFGDAADADTQLEAIKELNARSEHEVIEVDELDLDPAYALWSETYEEIPNALIQTEEPFVRSLLAGVPPGRALDAACGTGRLSLLLTDFGHDVVGVDPSAQMLERARAKSIPAMFLRGDLLRLPLADGSADLAVCGLALTHFDDLSTPLAELARVVRPGGQILLSDVHPIAVATGAQAMFKARDGSRSVARNHVHWFNAYLDAFVDAGLEVVQCQEPLVDEAFVEELSSDPDLRAAARASLLGLPLALIWLLRRR